MKLTPGPQLLVADLCMYRNMVTPLKKTTLLMLYILFSMHLLLSRPLVSYNLRQKP